MECILCSASIEDLKHMIFECPALSDTRGDDPSKIADSIPCVYEQKAILYSDKEFMLQMLIDCSSSVFKERIPLSDDIITYIERQSQKLLMKLHLKRASLLKSWSQNHIMNT